jgi:hypothetical protein
MLLAVVAGLGLALPCSAQVEPKSAPQISLNNLSMEVAALQALHQLNLDHAQLEKLQKLAEGTAQKDQERKAGKASKEYRDNLQALRKALTAANDGEAIAKLNDDLDALHDKEKPVFNDRVDLTEAARKRGPEAYRLLKANQLAAYLGQIADNVANPLELVAKALDEVREFSEEEWKENHGAIAEDIARTVAGLDSARAKQASDQVTALLVRARKLAKADFQKQQADLEQTARKIVGNAGAETVLRNHVEYELALLLANPRLPQALRARLKNSQ